MGYETQQKKKLLEHPLFVAVISAIAGAIVTAVLSNAMIAHEYVSFDGINTMLDTFLVKPGYVDASILELESAQAQFEMLETTIRENYVTPDDLEDLLRSGLVESGFVDESILELETVDEQLEVIGEAFKYYAEATDTSLINLGFVVENTADLTLEGKLNELSSLAQNVGKENQTYANQVDALTKENAALRAANEEYKVMKTAELYEARLIIDGELMNLGEVIKNAVAVVDGHTYYSQTLLNTFILEEDIVCNKTEGNVVLGNEKPEKVRFSWDDMVSDGSVAGVYRPDDGKTFSMATNVYKDGLILAEENWFYIQLGSEYSTLAFTYGHIDGENQSNLNLTIIAMDENGETYSHTIQTIELIGTMQPKRIEIPLGYAKAIKIVVSDGNRYARYGLTDICLYT